MTNRTMRVAVIGSGISGISAAYLLSCQKKPGNQMFKVSIFESSSDLGGHTNSVEIPEKDFNGVGREDERGIEARVRREKSSAKPVPPSAKQAAPKKEAKSVKVDTGFIVCNPVTYPNFLAMMDHLEVKLVDSNMSFSVCRNLGEFEWAGKNLASVFCQKSNIFSPSMYRMIYEILCFNQQATELAEEADLLEFDAEGNKKDSTVLDHPLSKMTFGQFFEKNGYSSFFFDNYILPMTAAIWSSPADVAFANFPMLTLIRFMRNHCLLQVGNRPVWRTVMNGSESYIEPALRNVDNVYLNTKITSIIRPDNVEEPVVLIDENGIKREFDHVIFATHADQALAILGDDATNDEKEVLGAFKFSKNTAYLHSDHSLMPSREKAWSSWNYLTFAKDESQNSTMCLTYWMNRLQPFVDAAVYGDIFVTLNPPFPPLSEHLIQTFEYDHPVYTPATIEAQEKLPLIQNKKRATFTGAWTNYGFHEDGCTSGLLAAISIGAQPTFEVSLNGGYPTHRKPTSPPPHLKVDEYKACPPTRIPHVRGASFYKKYKLYLFAFFGLLLARYVSNVYNGYLKEKGRVIRSKDGTVFVKGFNGKPNLVF